MCGRLGQERERVWWREREWRREDGGRIWRERVLWEGGREGEDDEVSQALT